MKCVGLFELIHTLSKLLAVLLYDSPQLSLTVVTLHLDHITLSLSRVIAHASYANIYVAFFVAKSAVKIYLPSIFECWSNG